MAAERVYYFTGLLILASLALFPVERAVRPRLVRLFLLSDGLDRFVHVGRTARRGRPTRPHEARRGAVGRRARSPKRVAKHRDLGADRVVDGRRLGALFRRCADAGGRFRDVPHASVVAYVWIGILTFTTYYLAGRMREQVCLYMCPWPRIQAALTDVDALNVTYRRDRGEPRMSLKEASKERAAGQPAGDCIDCYQCVAVCPTGIDIRKGSQLGCIQCGLFIDACDTVMKKVNRPTRLISYDTDENIKRRQRGEAPVYRIVRSRTILYVVVIAIVGALMLYQLTTRHHMGLSVLHVRAPMFTTARDGAVRNGYTLRFSNKSNETHKFAIEISGIKGAVAKSEETDTLPDGRLMVSVDPEFDAGDRTLCHRAALVGDQCGRSDRREGDRPARRRDVSVSDHFFGP